MRVVISYVLRISRVKRAFESARSSLLTQSQPENNKIAESKKKKLLILEEIA